jgi:hypothetical protein
MLSAGILSFIMWRSYNYHWIFMLVTFIGFLYGISYAFFRWRSFRYTMTFMFSIIYGLIGYWIGKSLDKETLTAGIVLGIIAVFISVIAHKDHFDFLKRSEVIEYE